MIRRATPDDLELVKALRLDALADSPSAYFTTYEEAAAYGDDVWLERLQPDAHPTFVSENGTQADGMVVCMIDRHDASLAHLVAMWVRPSARGTGVGGLLVDHLLDWARGQGASAVELRVTHGNDPAERLYARHGFERTDWAEVRERDGLGEFGMRAGLD